MKCVAGWFRVVTNLGTVPNLLLEVLIAKNLSNMVPGAGLEPALRLREKGF